MKYSLFLAGALLCLTIGTQGQDSLRQKFRTPLQNPYRNLKTSFFIQTGASNVFGRTYGLGVEVRRFFSLKEYVYFGLSYNQWTQNKDRVKNDLYQPCAYYLNTRTASIRTGIGVFGHSNLLLGAYYLMDVQLKEKVPSVLDPETNIFLNGNITPYSKPVIPFLGYTFRYKIWRIMFIEAGLEIWFFQKKIFQPLEGNWRVPDNVSPLLSEDYSSGYPNGYVSLHFKL